MSDPSEDSRPHPDKDTSPASDSPRIFRKKVMLPPALDSIMKDVAPDAAQAQGTGFGGVGPMARLERRLSMVERAFADISDRHESALRDRASQLASVEESVLTLCRRLDDSEKQQGVMLTELHEAMLQAGSRLNALEAGPKAPAWSGALDTAMPGQIEEAVAAAVPMQMPAKGEDAEISMLPDTGRSEETYLSSARRAARESLAAEIGRPSRAAKPRGTLNRARLLIFGAMAPLVIAGVAITVLNRHGVSAQAVPAPQPVSLSAPVRPKAPAASATDEQAAPTTPATLRNLGLDYLSGRGVPMNDSEAARLLLQAAYLGDTTAQYWLGMLYTEGRGVPADAYQADHWYETAAKAGNPKAMHRFAVANLQGRGMDKNESEAARWFRNAAQRGFVDSAFNLAVLYEEGLGVPRSERDAYQWYAIAAIGGDSQAAARLPEVAKSLPPAEIALAQHAAQNFHPLAPGSPVSTAQ